ncbi:MAG: DinB family protein [Bacteroidota bacterium]|nr:DinB family protein [Bacteroidota bacterium]
MQKSKSEIVGEMKNSFDLLCQVGEAVPDNAFNISKENKWTTAENLEHLARATKMTTMAFTLPKFLHVLLYGKPGRTSHGYSKLVDNYEKKLEAGAHATGVYVPKKTDYTKPELLDKLKANGNKLTNALSANWSDEQLDHYQVSHPILGLLTVRELAYFTIYHNGHHLETIRKYYL